MENKQIPLSLEEYASLKKELRSQYITSISLSLLVIGLLHCMFYIKFGQFTFPKYEILILATMLLISGFLTMKFAQPLRQEIELGFKIIEKTNIENKYCYDGREILDTPSVLLTRYYDRLPENDKNKGKDKTLVKRYIIVAGGKKYFADKKVFEKAQISGLLSIHLSPLRFKILRLES
ncbi:MAG: hypothetical protein U0W24_11415 [Bacteroidales bacterium]